MDGEIHHHYHPNDSDHNHYVVSDDGNGNGGTSIHITALDGIVNVNSLFTFAVFIGLAWNPSDPTTFTAGNCSASPSVAESMISFHVFSFASFLFSSLVALCLKQAIRIFRAPTRPRALRVNRAVLRAGILTSAVGSFFGCGFLMLALVDVVQIKLGRIGCGGATVGAVIALVTLIPAAMLIYVGVIFYAFTRCDPRTEIMLSATGWSSAQQPSIFSSFQ